MNPTQPRIPGRLEADERFSDLLALTQRLTAVLSERHEALRSTRPLASPAAHDDMLKLANLYRAEIQRLRADRAMVAAADPKLRQALKSATRAFETTLGLYLQGLDAIRTVTEGLVRAIGEEVAAVRAGPAGYAPRGKTGAAHNSGPAGAQAAIALNQKA